MNDDPLLTVKEVKKMLGGGYESVCYGDRCLPLRVNGERMYVKSMVERGLRQDRDLHPNDYEGEEEDKDAPGPTERVNENEEIMDHYEDRARPTPGGEADKPLPSAMVRQLREMHGRIMTLFHRLRSEGRI